MKEITRRDFLKTAGLATLIGVTGCATTPRNEDYTFRDFKNALGEQYDALSYEDKRETRKAWNELAEDGFDELAVEIYKDLDGFFRSEYEKSNLDKEDIRRYRNLSIEEARVKYKEHIEEYIPWMKVDSLSKEDITLITILGDFVSGLATYN